MTRAPLLALLLAGCASSTAAPSEAQLPRGPVALRARGLDGEPITLGALRGRIVVVTVIATWADTALLEVPRLKSVAEKYPEEQVTILCLALDDLITPVQVFADSFDLPYLVGVPEDRERLVGPQGPFGPITMLPTSVLLAPSGQIALRTDGLWPEGVLEEAIERLLAEDRGNR